MTWDNEFTLDIDALAQAYPVALDPVTQTCLVVGEPGYSSGKGRFRVYNRTGANTWSWTRDVNCPTGLADGFASSVCISNGTIAAGAPGDDDVRANSGAIYVYINEGVTLQQKLKQTHNTNGQIGGYGMVALVGDRIVSGDPWHYAATSQDGCVRTFTRNPATGVWTEEQEFPSHTPAIGGLFGQRVSYDGTRIAVVQAYALASVNRVQVFTHPSTWQWEVSFSPTSTYVLADAAINGTILAFWEGKTGSTILRVAELSGTWSETDSVTYATFLALDSSHRISISSEGYIAFGEPSYNAGHGAIHIRAKVLGAWTETDILEATHPNPYAVVFGYHVSAIGSPAAWYVSGAEYNESYANHYDVSVFHKQIDPDPPYLDGCTSHPDCVYATSRSSARRAPLWSRRWQPAQTDRTASFGFRSDCHADATTRNHWMRFRQDEICTLPG
jgi:hypothetical protein